MDVSAPKNESEQEPTTPTPAEPSVSVTTDDQSYPISQDNVGLVGKHRRIEETPGTQVARICFHFDLQLGFNHT